MFQGEKKSLMQQLEEIKQKAEQNQSQITPEEQDKKAKSELEAFTNGLINKPRKVHQPNNTLPSSPVKEEKQELNLNKPLHEMTVDERVVYATLHKKEIEDNHYADDKTLKKNKGYAFSALAEALLGTMFDTPDEYNDELDEAEEIL